MSSTAPRVRLVILFGGQSAEHEISCISASHVLAAVNADRYDVVPVGITRDGGFVRAEPAAELAAVGRDIDPLPVLVGKTTPAETMPAETMPGSTVAGGTHSGPTVVLPILHGPNGEDGTIQGLLEIAGLPYVGSGVMASAVAMDKAMAKIVLEAHGIAQVPWRSLEHHQDFREVEAASVLGELGPTVFVKPANMGSSIGVSKVDSAEALLVATGEAFRYDDTVVFEHGVVGHELECAVLGNDEPRASVLGEVVTGAEFYDYGDKYFDGTAATVIPAEVGPEQAEAARALAVATFSALRCSGMARVDMFLTDDGDLLVNEVNTIPGFTPISMYPKLWEASGLPYDRLIDELVRLALERHERRSSRAVSPS